MEKNATKIVKVTLDDLPFGTEADMPEPGSKFKRSPLPEGITHKMLFRDIIIIAWPAFLELVLTQLTSMADQIMVGRLPGSAGVQALAAVGLSMQPKFMLMTMIQALNVGATALVARFRGQGKRERANVVFRMAIVLNIVLAAIFMTLGIVFADQILNFMGGNGVSAETHDFAVQYLTIQMYGFIPLSMTFAVTGALRGIGDSKVPLIYNTTANVVNLFFNYCLIYGKFGFPEMQVAGASLATVIGQTVAFIIAYIFVLNKKRYLYISFKEKFIFDTLILKDMVNIGLPSMFEQLVMRIGVIIYTRTVAGLGDIQYATHQVCLNIQAMSFMTGQAFASSSTTLMGQSLGKKRIDMASNYIRDSRLVGLCVSIVLGLCLALFGRSIVSLYNDSEDIIALGGSILIMVACTQPFQSSQFIVSGGLRGAGDTRFPAVVMLITVIIVRSGLAMLLIKVFHMGLWGAWYAMVADQVLRSLLIVWHYNRGKWRFIKLHG